MPAPIQPAKEDENNLKKKSGWKAISVIFEGEPRIPGNGEKPILVIKRPGGRKNAVRYKRRYALKAPSNQYVATYGGYLSIPRYKRSTHG